MANSCGTAMAKISRLHRILPRDLPPFQKNAPQTKKSFETHFYVSFLFFSKLNIRKHKRILESSKRIRN
jgi:hypothetical protein